MNSINTSCLATACGGEAGEEENVKSDMGSTEGGESERDQRPENWGVPAVTSTLSVKSEEKRHFWSRVVQRSMGDASGVGEFENRERES